MRRLYVQITGPKTPTRYVRCATIDECLEVVQREAEDQPKGVVFNLIEIKDDVPRPLARWATVKRGKLERGAYG